MPSRFVVEDGETLDTRNREIISRDQLAQIATPDEQAQMDDEIEASGWAGADQSLDTPDVARSSSTTAPQVDTTPSAGPLSSSPSLDDFMRVAKQDNPGVPESSLRKYWAQKYGKINPKTLPSLEAFMPAAREDNPDLPDDVLRVHWQERYGDLGARETEPKVGFGGTLLEGAKSAGRSLKAAGQALIGDSSGVADTAAAQQAAEKDPALERLLLDIQTRKDSLGKDPSFLDTAGELGKAVLQNPKGAGLLLTEQLPNSAVAMGAAAAGAAAGSFLGPIGTIAGGLAGLFGANTALETGSKAIEAGADQAFTPDERSRVLTEGAKKGAVITGIDAASFGLTKWITGTTTRAVERATTKALTDAGVDVADKAAVLAARSNPAIVESVQLAQKNATAAVNTLGQKLSRGAGALGVESIGEGAGEYLGEYAASGNPDKMEALIEAFAGLGQSAGEIATTQALNRRRGDATRLPPAAPAPSIGHTPTADIPDKLGVGDPTVGIDHSIATAWELLNEDTEAQERNAIAAQKQAERQLLQGPSPSLEIPRTGTEIPILQGPESPQTWTPRIAPGHAFTPRETPEPNALEQMRTERRGLIWDEMQQPNATQSDMPQPAMSATPPESDIPLQSAADLAYPPSERGKIPTQQDLLRQQNREQPRSGYEVPTLPAAQQDASPLITPGSVFTPRATVQPTPQEGIEAERHRIRTEQKAAERAKILSMKRTKPVALPPQSYDEPAQLKQDVPLTKAIDRAYPSVSMLHEIAQAKGFDIDSQVFKTITKMVTGKEHLDSLTPGERDRFAEKLGRMEAHKTPAVVESATQSALKPVKPVAPSNDAITAPRSALPPEKNAEMLLRAEKAKADLEIDQALPQVPIVKFLKDKGGVQDQGGELSTMEVDGERAPFSKNLINEKGMTLDDAAELAHEAGYIQARDISLLLDSIDRETRGQGGASDWYKQLTTGPKPLSRTAIDTAIEKIIKDHGLDTGKAVERVKSALLNDGDFDGSQWGEDAASILRGDWPAWIEKPSAPLQSGPAASQQPVSASPPTEGTTTLRPSTEAAKRFAYLTPLQEAVKKRMAERTSQIDAQAQEAATSEENEAAQNEPFALQSQEVARKRTEKPQPEQTSIDVPPPTVGSRPIIGREVTPEEAPLFSEAAKQPDAEQTDLTDSPVSDVLDTEPTASADDLPIDQIPADLIVDVQGIREQTGEEMTVKENAREAVARLDASIARYTKLLGCLTA